MLDISKLKGGGGLGRKYYPSLLHCEQADAACLSKYLPFSNWGRKQKFIALFFKALTRHILKCVCNTLFCPFPPALIQSTPCKRGEWGESAWWWKTEGKPALPGSCWEADLEPCFFCSSDFFRLTCTSDKDLGSGAHSDHAVLFPELVMLLTGK